MSTGAFIFILLAAMSLSGSVCFVLGAMIGAGRAADIRAGLDYRVNHEAEQSARSQYFGLTNPGERPKF